MAVATALSLPCIAADWRDRFFDPDDGQLDLSAYLLDHRGALVVPVIITEPAVGYGGGAALAWFSESINDVASRARTTGHRVTPPDIYAVAAVGTENGTKGAAAAARLSFRDDSLRYRGGIFGMSVNLDFFGVGGTLAAPGIDKIGYNLKGYATFHELTHRLGESDQFLGLRFLYLDLKTRLDFGTPEDAGLTPRELAKRSSGLGVTFVHDSRDNIFTPRRGVQGSIDAMFYSPSIGSDTTFQSYRAHAFAYMPVGEAFTAAIRIDGRAVRGDVPFYQLPFIELRGIPAARYQDESIGVLEAEARWYVTPRWALVGFMGGGRAWGRSKPFDETGTQVGKGLGFRYMIARRIGFSAGIDVARGPEGNAWYIQAGNSWR